VLGSPVIIVTWASDSGTPQVVTFTVTSELAGVGVTCAIAVAFLTALAAVVGTIVEPRVVANVAVPSLVMPVRTALVSDTQSNVNCVLSDIMIAVGRPWESKERDCQLPSAATLFTPYKAVGFPLESRVPRKVRVLWSLFVAMRIRLSVMSLTKTTPPALELTVSGAVPWMLPAVADILVLPCATVVTSPWLLMVAVEVEEEDHNAV